MASKSTTSRNFRFGGDVYHITVRSFDKDLGHVTADWWRASDRQEGRLGYGVVSADVAIRLAEQAICIHAALRLKFTHSAPQLPAAATVKENAPVIRRRGNNRRVRVAAQGHIFPRCGREDS